MTTRWPDLMPRTLSAIVLALVAGTALVAGGWWVVALVAVLGGVMIREWRQITLGGCDCQADYGMGRLAIVGGVFLEQVQGPIWGLAFVTAASVMGAITDHLQGRNWRWGLLGTLYIGAACIGFLALRQQVDGLSLSLGLALMVVATDIGAYFAGRLIGGPKLAPVLSPKKTWSGLIGGAVFSVAVAMVWAAQTRVLSMAIAISIGVAAAILAQAGDIAESAVKRRFGVKDSGHWLPGHGGALDRFDGFLAVSLAASALLIFGRSWE